MTAASPSAYAYDGTVRHPTALSGFQWAFHGAGQARYTATGTCPACGCATTARWPIGSYVAKGGKGVFRRRSAAPDPGLDWSSPCRCTGYHPGRPEGVYDGCGARLKIAVPSAGLPS